MHARALLTASLSFLLFASSCCCCSTEWLDLPENAQLSDEPEIERLAQEYAREHAPELFAPVDGGQDECVSGAVGLALDLGVAIVTRGHASGNAAGHVTFDLPACAKRLVVFVVKSAAGFAAVGAILHDRSTNAELRRVGAPPSDFNAVDTSSDIDEFF